VYRSAVSCLRAHTHTHTHTHAHAHTHSQRPCTPLAPHGSIFSQRFPFSFCRARAPPPPFVITPRLKIPYVAAAAYPFLLLPSRRRVYLYVYIIRVYYNLPVCESVWGSLLLHVHTYVCLCERTYICNIFSTSLSFSLSLSLFASPNAPRLPREFSSLQDFLRIFPFAQSLLLGLLLLVSLCVRAYGCICVCRLIDFFP